MKKQFFTILLGLTLISSMTMAPAFAETVDCQKPIENAAQLKSAIALAMTDGELSDEEEAQIMAEATEEAVADLMQEKLDEAVEILDGTDMTQNMEQLPDGSEYGLHTYDLGDGCQMTVELSDRAEGLEPGTAAPLSTTGEWKDYGNRYFTAKATVTIGKYDIMLGLKNHYILSSNGIDENYGEQIYDPGKSQFVIIRNGWVEDDGAARTPGASDVNMHCTFTCKAEDSNSKYRIDTTVKYLAHNKTGKRIKVAHAWKLTKIS